MQEPRRGPLTRRGDERGGRRDTDEALAQETPGDDRPIAVVVEDDQVALNGLAVWLDGEGFAVLACPTFAEARAQLTRRRVTALLTDIRLAEFNGLHLVQLARTLHPGACLVVFSGYADDGLQHEAQAAGAAWFQKPIDLHALREHLLSHLRSAPPAGDAA
jgi:DNA-binding response OmpR family regulator